jgi:hypothetical protein
MSTSMLTHKDKHDIPEHYTHGSHTTYPHLTESTSVHHMYQKSHTFSPRRLLLPQQSRPSHSTRCCCHSIHTHLTEPVVVAIRHTHLNQPVVGATAVTCTSTCFHTRDTRLYTVSYCIHSSDNHITQPVVIAAAVSPTLTQPVSVTQ